MQRRRQTQSASVNASVKYKPKGAKRPRMQTQSAKPEGVKQPRMRVLSAKLQGSEATENANAKH